MTEERIDKMAGMEPIQVEKKSISLIWLLPLIAAMIAGWLLYKGISEAGVTVQIEFESAEGIEEKKTRILYKGLSVGLVKKVKINSNLQSVLVEAEMKPGIEAHLRDETHFWLVKPKVSLTEVTGLETLVSGNYIAISPGEGARRSRFKALSKRPPMDNSTPGLHLKLKAASLGSIEVGSPVYYREIAVGRVEGIELQDGGEGILIGVHIEEQYASLVKRNSRFWNISGINVKASLSGIELHTGSLASMIAGGISFYTPISDLHSPQSESGELFTLFADYKSAEDGIMVKLHLPRGESVVAEKTKVYSGELEVGVVKGVEVDEALLSTATIKFHPHANALLKETTKFWIADPDFSFSQLPNVNALLKGRYIAIKGGEGEARFDFKLLEKRPVSDRSELGLYLTLIADELGSLKRGSPVLYRKVMVGHVEDFQLNRQGNAVEIQIYIEEKQAHLVQMQSRFWNASGIDLHAGLDGFKLRTESVGSLLTGGIAFLNPDDAKSGRPAKRDDRFRLYEDKESAKHDSFPIEIALDGANGLQEGAAVKFQGLKVGRIDKLELTGEGAQVVVHGAMYRKSRELIRKGTRFWVVQPKLGLARSENLDTLVSGRYIALRPGKGALHNAFEAIKEAPAEEVTAGLQLILVSERLGSIKPGDPIYYRQIPVGRVLASSLAPKNNAVLIRVNIEKKYAPLVRDSSQFWPVSGIRIGGSLLGGVEIETESVESLLSGGIAFATPMGDRMGNRVGENHTFELKQKMDPAWAQWAPKIMLDQ